MPFALPRGGVLATIGTSGLLPGRAPARNASVRLVCVYEIATRGGSMAEKTWGAEPFWGLGYDWDPDWLLTDRQQELRAELIDLCEQELRANAKRSDDELLFPRRNLELLG